MAHREGEGTLEALRAANPGAQMMPVVVDGPTGAPVDASWLWLAPLALFADYIPFYAGGVFSLSKKLEVGGQLYTDLKNDAFDTMSIEVLGRAYF